MSDKLKDMAEVFDYDLNRHLEKPETLEQIADRNKEEAIEQFADKIHGIYEAELIDDMINAICNEYELDGFEVLDEFLQVLTRTQRRNYERHIM